MADLIVSKYGGSSITDYEHVKRIERITNDDPRRKIAVVSAPGKQYSYDTKVTDLLMDLAEKKDHSLVEKIIGRYHMLCPDEDVDEISRLLQGRQALPLEGEQYIDALKAFGEEACALLIAEALGFEYVDPKELFLVSEDYGNAKIQEESAEMIKEKLGGLDEPCIVPGFYGYTEQGNIATFSRGGSDLTGAYIAAALEAEVYENFTDTDGVYAATLKVVKNPRKIDIITFDEMRDLAYSGFGVFHRDAIHPVRSKKIPVHVRNTFNYPSTGTYIVPDRPDDTKRPIAAVAYKDGFCSFDTSVFGLNEMVGVLADITRIFAEEKISVEFITTGIDDMAFIIREEQLESSDSAKHMTEKFCSVLGKGGSVDFQENLGALVVAGNGLKGKRGIAGNIQQTLDDAGVNIKFISQGPSERCIVYGINDSDSKKALNAVYDEYLA